MPLSGCILNPHLGFYHGGAPTHVDDKMKLNPALVLSSG